jgi:hypothetical protein
MFLRCIRCHGTLHKCKNYCAVVILMSIMVIFQSHTYFFLINKKSDFLPVIGIEADSSLFVPMIYEDRSRTLSGKCNHSDTAVFNIRQYAPASLIASYPWLNAALFPLQSKSLMYCAVPKIASKTIMSLMIYVYVRDVIQYLNNNWANINVNRTRTEQLIDIPKLIQQLRKV